VGGGDDAARGVEIGGDVGVAGLQKRGVGRRVRGGKRLNRDGWRIGHDALVLQRGVFSVKAVNVALTCAM